MYELQNIIKKYISKNNVDIIINFFNDNNIKNIKFSNQKTIPLIFHHKNQFGGVISKDDDKQRKDDSVFMDVYLDKNKYQVRLYKYTEKDDKNFKTINFIKIESKLQEDGEFSNCDYCAVLIIDTKNKESNIQSVSNYKDCIKCYYENNKMYKIGDILIQVMISMSINKKMEKINLHDNSNYKCNGYNLPLIILRTMTHGKPFYAKYGFLPLDHNKTDEKDYKKNELQIYEDNKKLFRTQPKMTKNEMLKIIYYTKFDKNKDKNMLNYINNIVIPRLNENNNIISNFLNDIISDSLIYQEFIYNKNNKSIQKDNNVIYLSSACELLDNILMVIYLKCGYYKYIEKTFELNLKNDKIIRDYKKKIRQKIMQN